ncbi:MAG: SoxR reducing system RseC family protein, partial [Bacteroidales bacterium]
MSEIIEHPGIVKAIKDKQTLIVSIISTSACNHCSSKEACTMTLGSEAKEKEVEVFVSDTAQYSLGDSVIVKMKLSTGNLAVLLSYVVPLIIMLATVFIVFAITKNEGISGILGLIILVPYY